MANTTILSGNYKPNTMALSPTESDLFEQGFDAIATVYDTYGTTALSDILRSFKNLYKTAAGFAKADFQGATFGGTTENSGFNMQLIRAATVLTQGASTPVYSWTRNITSTGFQAFFGSKDAPLSMGNVASPPLTTTSVAYTYQNVVLFFTHLLSHTPPKFDEIMPGIGSTNYPIFVTTYERVSNVYITQLPSPMYVTVNGQFYIEGNFQRLGIEDTQLLGVQFVKSSYAFNQ